jgi:diadenylate cyclase
VTEDSDALSVIVSEETGQIAVAHNGRLIRNLDQDRLRRVLRTLMRLDRPEATENVPVGRIPASIRNAWPSRRPTLAAKRPADSSKPGTP